MVYLPIGYYWVYLCIKARSVGFFSATNPTIFSGGYLMESKWDIHQIIPADFSPDTFLVKRLEANIEQSLIASKLSFPFYAKPDIGGKGLNVKKIESLTDAIDYHKNAKSDYLWQANSPYPNEVGIFYVRMPNEPFGIITGIVQKEFLTVTGDGTSSILALMQQNKRAILQIPQLKKNSPELLSIVLKANEEKVIVPYGNHARGAKFLDYSHKITPTLTNAINDICTKIDGFYFGRIDIMYNNWESLEQGKDFLIIEVNGSGSEPTHIYDPAHSILFAWREIMKHWKYMFKVAKQNHAKGVPYMSLSDLRLLLKQHKMFIKQSS
jgi:hypothetical protein